jgi:hypothetical protein
MYPKLCVKLMTALECKALMIIVLISHTLLSLAETLVFLAILCNTCCTEITSSQPNLAPQHKMVFSIDQRTCLFAMSFHGTPFWRYCCHILRIVTPILSYVKFINSSSFLRIYLIFLEYQYEHFFPFPLDFT